MKRLIAWALMFAVMSSFSLGCGDKASTTTKSTTSTPGGTKTVEDTKTVKETGNNPPANP
jgi:hypothetical protein